MEVYAGAPQSSSAAQFGTMGITVRARKAATDEQWQAARSALACHADPSTGEES